MDNPLLKLQNAQDSMSATEANISAYILAQPKVVRHLTVRELSKATYSSASSVLRVCRHIGYSGYREFQNALDEELAALGSGVQAKGEEIRDGASMAEIIEKVTAKNSRILEDTMRLLDPDTLSACVELLLSCRAVLLFGLGASFVTAKDTYLKFLRLNKMCVVNEDWHSQLLMARNSSREDAALIFSYGGQTQEMVRCMQTLKKNGTPCIAITRYASSPVAKLADYCLYVAANESLFRNGAMASRIAQLNVVDILYTAYSNRMSDYSARQLLYTHIQKEGPDLFSN